MLATAELRRPEGALGTGQPTGSILGNGCPGNGVPHDDGRTWCYLCWKD
jgi:hypothetical protein